MPHYTEKYLGGPWDGLEKRIVGSPRFGKRFQVGHEEAVSKQLKAAGTAGIKAPTHMSIYVYDKNFSSGTILYCRYVKTYSLEAWRKGHL